MSTNPSHTPTDADARAYVIAAIEGNGRDVARHEDYDVDAIVTNVYRRYGTWDFATLTADEDVDDFWYIVETHER